MGCLNKLAGCIGTIIIILAIIAAILYFWLVPQLSGKIEDGLRKKLMLGPSATVEIQDTGIIAMSQGRIEKVVVDAPEARVNDYVVKNLKFDAEGLKFDLIKTAFMGDPVIDTLGEGELSFDVPADTLASVWKESASKIGVSDFKLTLSPKDSEVGLEGKWKISWLNKEFPFSAKAKLSVRGGSLIFFEIPEIQVGDLKVGLDRLKDGISKISPRIDLGDYKVKLDINDISITNSGIHIEAHAEEAEAESSNSK
ncbi:MAG: LmeA family phospholipid-binding protein [bacterium]|jgi:hypothetical protein